MKVLLPLLFVCLAVAGCLQDSDGDGDNLPGLPSANLPPLQLTVEVPEGPVKGLVLINVTTSRAAQVAVEPVPRHDFVGDHITVNGTATFELDLEPGLATIGVDAFAPSFGGHYSVHEVNVLAMAVVTIDYGAASDKEPVNDTVWVDLATHASQAQYDAEGATHPEYTNIHDVLASWEVQEGHTVEYAYSPSIEGFSVSRIDGEGNAIDAEDGAAGSRDPPYWCYTVNDDSGVSGITAQRFYHGDRVHWELGSCGTLGLMP